MDTRDRWSTPRLAEFVAAVTGAADETSAILRAVEWATEALEAEIGLVIENGLTLASVGFPRGVAPLASTMAAHTPATDEVDIAGIGTCRLLSTQLELDSAIDIVVARAGRDAFSREEVGLLRAAARSLTMTLRLFRALGAERTTSQHLQKRQHLLERLSGIQRSITRRLPLPDVLQSIAQAARDLLDVDVTALRLIDPHAPGEIVLVSSEGLESAVAAAIHRTSIGGGAAGRAVAEDRLVVIEDYSGSHGGHATLVDDGVKLAMAAPIHDGDAVTGAIVVGTRRSDLVFGDAEKEALIAFADHASLAIIDAKRVEHIQQLAFHDELTGLPNRGLFMERLGQALLRARRRRGPVAVLFLDIDRFKTINDSLGHTAGDQLLVDVGARLRRCLRGEDTAARLGGDEFAILAHCARNGAVEIARRVLAAMEPTFVIDARAVSAAASIGIALDQDGSGDAGGMLRDADTAMYRAKLEPGTGYMVFEPSMHAAALARIDLEADLRGAVGRQELTLDYQPIVDLTVGTVTGVEALVRWEHPERGLISPLSFIPVAEEIGQIGALGRWVLDEACRQVSRWRQMYPNVPGLSVSVNVSKRQLQDGRFLVDVSRSLQASGLSPGHLTLEITESAVMVDVATAIERLAALRALGVSLAIDDFGTGQSSLALLRRLPVDIIKIDKLFVDAIATDATAASFLETIVRLAGILSLEVVIEGIESAEQVLLVAAFGDIRGQGYQLGRPARAAVIEELLASGGAITLPVASIPPAGGTAGAAPVSVWSEAASFRVAG